MLAAHRTLAARLKLYQCFARQDSVRSAQATAWKHVNLVDKDGFLDLLDDLFLHVYRHLNLCGRTRCVTDRVRCATPLHAHITLQKAGKTNSSAFSDKWAGAGGRGRDSEGAERTIFSTIFSTGTSTYTIFSSGGFSCVYM